MKYETYLMNAVIIDEEDHSAFRSILLNGNPDRFQEPYMRLTAIDTGSQVIMGVVIAKINDDQDTKVVDTEYAFSDFAEMHNDFEINFPELYKKYKFRFELVLFNYKH